MKALLVAAVIVACASAQMAPLLQHDSPTRIPGEYVVIFDTDVTDKQVFSHMVVVRNLMGYQGNTTKSHVMNEYHIGSFRGYGARMDDKQRDLVRAMDHIQYVECSQIYRTVQADCALQTGATWGIVRTTYKGRPTSNDYSYKSNAGEGVDVYIIDTGIFTTDDDFQNRAKWGIDYIDDPSPERDLNGHGTHVAGTVMGEMWGLAKKATSIAVRVLNEDGSGTTNGVVSGIDWTAAEHSKRGRKSVANMSLGGGRSTALNKAVLNAVAEGVNFAVAAGNDYHADACNVSPASACFKNGCVTVGASDEDDDFADFSNTGECVDIIAPGVAITSDWLNDGIMTISGTSMAAPHVAGVMAKYLSDNPSSTTPSDVKKYLLDTATKNEIKDLPTTTTPNKLLFFECV